MLQYFKSTPLLKLAILSASVLVAGVYVTIAGVLPGWLA